MRVQVPPSARQQVNARGNEKKKEQSREEEVREDLLSGVCKVRRLCSFYIKFLFYFKRM
jgi:hypothetical protein